MGGGGVEAQRAGSEQIEMKEGKSESEGLAFRLKEKKISGKENEIERNTSPGLHLFYLYEKHLDGSHQNQTLNFPPLNNKMQVLISSEMLLCTVQTKISWPLDL